LLSQNFEVNLITRPRRFGKTLMMSMLEDFFDIGRDSREDFKGLAISQDSELCAKWMNQWPVIFITLKSVDGNMFESAFGMFQSLIADLCQKYAFLGSIKNSLYILTRMMYVHYEKWVAKIVWF